jgi:hypothetical protein
MRQWRKTHPLTGDARKRAIARSYAKVYRRRGYLKARPCQVAGCANKAEMHHIDYSKPLLVEWLCRAHHLEEHNGRLPGDLVVRELSLKAMTPEERFDAAFDEFNAKLPRRSSVPRLSPAEISSQRRNLRQLRHCHKRCNRVIHGMWRGAAKIPPLPLHPE